MRRLVERLNEPFRRGVFGRDMRLGHIVVTAGERGPAATSRDRSASALPSLLIAGVAANSGAVPSTSGAEGLSLRRLGPSAAGHFAINLALQVPTLGMPILVSIVGSPALNASFYLPGSSPVPRR